MDNNEILQRLLAKTSLELGQRIIHSFELEAKLEAAEKSLRENLELLKSINETINELSAENKRLKEAANESHAHQAVESSPNQD